MSIYTFVVDFGTGPHPTISKHTDILGGTLNAVRFFDALEELESVTEQRDELLEALRGMWSIHDSVTMGQERERREEWIPKSRDVIDKATESTP